jgi:hypothetical protein
MGLEYGQSVAIRKRAVGKAMRPRDWIDSRPGDPVSLSKFGQFDKRMPRRWRPSAKTGTESSEFARHAKAFSPTKKSPAATAGLQLFRGTA